MRKLGDIPAHCSWRSGCSNPPDINRRGTWLCAMHCRFQQMRVTAGQRGVKVPSYEDLVEMVSACGMVCVGCKGRMHWLDCGEGRSLQATLQHDRSGAMRLLCLGCNLRHRKYPGDEFYNVPSEHKWCGQCRSVKPYREFHASRSQPNGLASRCKDCCYLMCRAWRMRNLARVAARVKEARRRRAAAHSDVVAQSDERLVGKHPVIRQEMAS